MTRLDAEARKITSMLRNKAVRVVRRHRAGEVMLEFDDGTRLFVNAKPTGLEFSITESVEVADEAAVIRLS